MGNGVLIEKNLLLVFTQLLRNAVEIDDAVVDWLFIAIVLADSESFRDGLQTFFKAVHFKVDEGIREYAVIDFVTHETDFCFFLKEIA